MIIKQFRYYDEDNRRLLNQPADISAEKLISGEYFKDIKCKEIQIKTYPGTKITINEESIYVGETGVYNILYQENMIISSIKIDPDSINYIKNSFKDYFVITFIQEENIAENKQDTNIIDTEESQNEDNPEEDSTSPIQEQKQKKTHDD